MTCDQTLSSLGQLINGKLGRCFACMRTASLLAATFAIAAVAFQCFFSGQRILILLLWGLAVIFTLLWLLHLTVFALMAYRSRLILLTFEGRPVKSPGPISFAASQCLKAMIWTSPIWWIPQAFGFAPARQKCNCYFDKDCNWWLLRFCDWSAVCNNVRKGSDNCPEHEVPGSCDGMCGWITPFSGSLATPESLVKRIDSVFELYISIARSEQAAGKPNPAQIEALWSDLPAPLCDEFRAWSFTVLRIALGWDLTPGATVETGRYLASSEMFFSHVADIEATPAILEATRDGLIAAINNRDAGQVQPALSAFWQHYPKYQPAHIGNCYPHGHIAYGTALECQLSHLSNMASVLMGAAGLIELQPPE